MKKKKKLRLVVSRGSPTSFSGTKKNLKRKTNRSIQRVEVRTKLTSTSGQASQNT
jgi:hypothetical protein